MLHDYQDTLLGFIKVYILYTNSHSFFAVLFAFASYHARIYGSIRSNRNCPQLFAMFGGRFLVIKNLCPGASFAIPLETRVETKILISPVSIVYTSLMKNRTV